MATMQAALTGRPTRERGLGRRALGVPSIVFFAVAASAPLTAVAGGQAVSYLVAGNRGVPLLFAVIAAALVLFAGGYAAMSRHVTSAGAFYSYAAQGLGRVAAVPTAFVALVAYNAMQIGVYGLFGVAFGAFVEAKLGIGLGWWAWCLIGWAVVAVLGVLQIDLNARVLAMLLLAEVVVVVMFDVVALGDPGPQGLSTVGFEPGVAFSGAVGAALTFCMASFFGIESSAIYSEECRDPRRTVARATYIAIAVVAGFYILSSWLIAVAAGPDTLVDPAKMVAAGFTADGKAPDPTTVFFVAGSDRFGALWGDAATLLFATSLFATILALHNTVARYVFALGREGVLPRACGRVQARTRAPYVGSLAQSLLAVAVLGTFAVLGEDPIRHLFTWLTQLGSLSMFLLLLLTSISVIGFFHHRPALRESAYTGLIAPALATVALAVLFVVALANFNVMITGARDAPLDPLTVVLPAVLLVSALAGVVVALVLRRKRPDVYAGIGEGGGHD